MSKTPVSTLQEYMAKNILGLPVYDLMSEITGTHIPSFTYRVKCGERYGLGTASTKKQAKHNAARELIKILSASNENPLTNNKAAAPSDVTQINSYYQPGSKLVPENDIFVNSVGKLSEHCIQHKLLAPQYEMRNISGPAHMMNFTMICSIGKLTTQATATTKKQAKHDAAQNMLRILMGGVKNKLEISKYADIEKDLAQLKTLHLTQEPKEPLVKSSKLALDLYPQLCSRGSVKTVKNIDVRDYHRALGKSIDHTKRENLRKEFSKISTRLSQSEVLEKIAKILNTTVETKTLVGNQNGWAVNCKLDSIPVLAEIGVGKTLLEAQTKATSNLLNTINNFVA